MCIGEGGKFSSILISSSSVASYLWLLFCLFNQIRVFAGFYIITYCFFLLAIDFLFPQSWNEVAMTCRYDINLMANIFSFIFLLFLFFVPNFPVCAPNFKGSVLFSKIHLFKLNLQQMSTILRMQQFQFHFHSLSLISWTSVPLSYVMHSFPCGVQ